MSLVLAGLVLAGTSGALVLGRWIARRRDATRAAERAGVSDADAARASDDDEQDPATGGESGGATPNARSPSGDRLEGFVCQLGDVVMRLTGEEAWLAGGVVLMEQIPVAVLFVAPDAGEGCAIFARAHPSKTITWLEPLDPSTVLVGGEPPTSVEHGGVRFERARRLPLRPRRIGVGAPDLSDAVIVAEYASAGAERLVVFKASSGAVRAYRGLELEEGAFEVIPSGRSTLDE